MQVRVEWCFKNCRNLIINFNNFFVNKTGQVMDIVYVMDACMYISALYACVHKLKSGLL